MIKHIVMWKLKDFAEEANKAVNAQKIKEIKHIEVGINIINSDASADVALYSEFECMEDLNIYQKHPWHQKIVQFIRNTCVERRVVDYEVL
ncbi:MAG: hypothetical protein A2099_05690 [Planctomycetes bacterium GWF2_39_10]|nr:MAG: hypothetical protein A2099_05690 [Planctomycetes bacterium GWF2_39_10]